ncbi:MAG: HEAT repeat domain-containing protein [bacterium]|nr:HEAT repeat domain-containing protein [bacterium]
MARSMVRFSTSLLSPAKDPEPLRYNAARLLGEMWVKEAVVPLRKVLREGGSRCVARAVLLALGRIGDRSALPDLLEAAQSDDFFIQIRAVVL